MREPETQAVIEAKAQLRGIVKDLRAVKRRVLAVVRQLRAAEATAPTVATRADGTRETAEDWMAGSLKDQVKTEFGTAIRLLAMESRLDWRPEIRRVVADDNRIEANAKDQAAVQTVAEANRAAILTAEVAP